MEPRNREARGRGRWWAGVLLVAACLACRAAAQEAAPLPPLTPDEVAPAEEPATSPDTATPEPPTADTAADKPAAKKGKSAAELDKAVAGAYKGVYYDNDFTYLLEQNYGDWHLGENLKRRELGCWGTLDVGGEYRMRFHSEHGFRGLGLTGADDDFLLHRSRLYANLELLECVRVYAEGLDAVSNYEDLPPRAIEENRAELQNAFADVRLWDGDRGELWARVGRQELLYGAQRTVSPLDWANTRRTFEGYKAYWRGEDWDIDAFWTRPVLPDPGAFDSPDYAQEFSGAYATCRVDKQCTWDFYFLRLVNQNADFDYDTLGVRYAAQSGPWLTEVEGAVQWGDYRNVDHAAGFWTAGLGRSFECLPWRPVVWGYYDWASGSDTIGNGYHHLFPLAHRYLGFMDLFGRRNIEDANVLLTFSPAEKWTLLVWYHVFRLQNGNDVPYSVVMTPLNAGNRPASRDLGQELDCTASWQITPRVNLLLGYSHFFSGDYYRLTPGLTYRGDADFYYTQLSVNF